ncbi:MAG: hypothetical protein HOP17_03340 [Acidobacteria bacterium]|nr:hypothetical protein [Acidobacteriota bacterium]
MAENKSSISKKRSYLEIGEYWDTHDLPQNCEEVEFTVELGGPDVHYFAVEDSLNSKLRSVAEKRGVSSETLLNLWLQEKLAEKV